MRTTLTLEDDLARELQERARRNGVTFKEVVNAAIRSGLSRGEDPATRLPDFVVDARPCGFRAGIDPRKLNQLNDELEADSFERKLRGESEPRP